VAVDVSGLVHRSSDGGVTWTAASPLPLQLEAYDLHFVSAAEGWVIGAGFAGSSLFRTADAGATWTPTDGFQGLYVALDFAGNRGWALRYDGAFQRTDDGGGSWSWLALPPTPGGGVVRDLDFWSADVGYAVGDDGYAVRSGDGGTTWQALPTPDATDRLTDLHLVGPDELWVSAADGTTLYSATGGQHWAALEAGQAGFGSFNAVAASPAGDAWIVGWRGAIRRFAGPPPPPVNQPPAASFDFQATGLSVAFTDTSTDADGQIVAWAWDFGDDATSTSQHPTHVFATAGTYHVHLTVTDDDGATDETLRFVVVQPGPGGTFGDFTEVTPFDPLFVTPQDEDFWVAASAPADYDADGDLDVAVLGFYVVYNVSVEHMLVLIRNEGPVDEEEWDFSYVQVPLEGLTAGASDLAWGDVDGDGDQDLAVGSDGETAIYRNDAGTLVRSDTALPGYQEDNDQAEFDLRSISWADFDNDGDLDLLLPSVWDEATFEFRTALMRNDGPNGTGGWSFVEAEAGLAPTRHAQSAWADFDGDQDLDLLLVHLSPLTDDGFVRRYRNDGGGVFVGEDILGAFRVERGEAQWGDYDEDGDLDVLVAGGVREVGGEFDSVLRVYRNDAETYVPIEILACPECDGWFDLSAATWADYDSDGDVDILLAGTWNPGSQIEGRAKIYDNVDGTFEDSGNQLPAPRSMGDRGGAFSWLDLDAEGDLDYFIAGSYFVPGGNGLVEAQMHVYRNDVEQENQPPTAPSELDAQVQAGGAVDLWWNPALDDSTPADALTYEVRVFAAGAPVSAERRLPEPGGVGATGDWALIGLPDGVYSWTVEAVDSAFNAGPAARGDFVVGEPPVAVFADGFESGDASGWTLVAP
jgi:PKD repeat protein